jgi:hypothetical protein
MHPIIALRESHLKRVIKAPAWCLSALCFIFAAYGRVDAAPDGPALHLDYGHGQLANPIGEFMCFVPPISPEPGGYFYQCWQWAICAGDFGGKQHR